MHQLVIKEGSVLLMHGVTMKFIKEYLFEAFREKYKLDVFIIKIINF